MSGKLIGVDEAVLCRMRWAEAASSSRGPYIGTFSNPTWGSFLLLSHRDRMTTPASLPLSIQQFEAYQSGNEVQTSSLLIGNTNLIA